MRKEAHREFLTMPTSQPKSRQGRLKRGGGYDLAYVTDVFDDVVVVLHPYRRQLLQGVMDEI